MGLKPAQYRCAAESLLRRFRKEGGLPRLHPLVDLCNAVSLAFAIPAAGVRELIAALAAEIGAIWAVAPARALLTPAEPRFTRSTCTIAKSAGTVNPSLRS